MSTKVSDTIKTVDFVPEYSITGDIRKVSEYDFASYNSKLFPIFTILTMSKGTNQLYPGMGLRETMMTLSYCEEDELEGKFSVIATHLKTYTGLDVVVALDEENSDIANQGIAVIQIQVSGVPAPLVVTSNGKSNFLNVRHPSLYT